MKSLIWKEWRERKLLLLIGTFLLIIGSIVTTLVFRGGSNLITYYIVITMAGILGADTFTKDKETFEFLLSHPLRKETIFLAKLLSGFLCVCALILLACILNAITYTSPLQSCKSSQHLNLLDRSVTISNLIKGSLYMYSITLFTSILFLDTISALLYSFLIGAVIGYIGIFIVLKLGLPQTILIYTYQYILPVIFIFLAYLKFKRREATP